MINNKKSSFSQKRNQISNITEFEVKKETTLLDFLYEHLKGLSRNNIKSILHNHQVAVGGAPTTQFDFKLFKEDIVTISKSRIKSKKAEKLDIIFENDEIIVINKPAGLLSIASDNERGKTAYRMLTEYVQIHNKKNRIFIVHRLDKETSGILMVAKDPLLRDALQKDWNELVLKRGYYAVVEGNLKEKDGTFKSYLMKSKDNLMFSTKNKKLGKESITEYKVLKENPNYSLIDINLKTGRKNQIRVQFGEHGHYVVGDDKYGKPSNPIHRLGLHAYELQFIHPFTKKKMKFSSKMPNEFMTVFSNSQEKAKTILKHPRKDTKNKK